MLSRETVFPKRVRWQYAQSLSRLTNIFDSLVNVADGIKVTCHGEYALRYMLLSTSLAVLSALDAKMTQAMRVLEVRADKFDNWTNLHKAAKSSLYRQINADKKRYADEYGAVQPDETLSAVIQSLLAVIGMRSI